MEAIDKLRQSLLQLAHAGGPPAFYDAEILSVNADDYTCDILLDEAPMYEVRLRAVVSDKQSIDVLPKVGAQVVVGKMADDDFIVVACDEITSYRVTVGNSVFTIDGDGVLISKGTETLKKILNELVDQILEIYAPKNIAGITAIKTRINSLLK